MGLLRPLAFLFACALLPGQEAARTVTLAAVGDTMVGSIYPSRAALPPGDGQRVFERVKDLWAGADIVMGNFEGAVAGNLGTLKALSAHSYRFLIPPEHLGVYRDAGFTVLNIANNHAMDAGLPGRAATLKAFADLGLSTMGSLEQPSAELTLSSGLKVGFIGTAPHMECFPLDLEAVSREIRRLKEEEGCALVFVSMHAGAEGEGALHVPKAKEIFLGADRGDVYAFAHGAIDAGADLVVGHGPHIPRGMEVYKDRLIAYSLGNFATHGHFNVKGVNGLGLVLEATVREDGSLLGLRIRSTRQEKGSEAWGLGIPVEPDPEEGARRLVERLSREDFGTDLAAWYLPDARW